MPEIDKRKKGNDVELSEATEKRIDQLPKHAQQIFRKSHASVIEEYTNPKKRRGSSKKDVKEVAHKVAWAVVKREYEKKGDECVNK